ncbi:HNH endonuclease domain-containing protein [Cellulosilyticum sp. I15G10I2]|uniref:HNH endonuclease domain-containing protein n=1 Tax=Cellulosilyticum sp. I15G10I2 TaxID=1892843 RepID=UPI00085CA458|nr:HNH endonuclease domain-containing protein [Cellulosilyticum sp. I15G10I2]
MIDLPKNSEVDIRIFGTLLEYKILSASYKPFWLSGIIKEVINGKREIGFKEIVCHMISSAWYPIVQYKLSFGQSDKLGDIVEYIRDQHEIPADEKEHVLFKTLYELQDKEVIKYIEGLYKLVPYRMLSPFYGELLRGTPEKEKNRKITEYALKDENAFYKIYPKQKMIVIGENWYKYLVENQNIIYGWINYKLIYFLQKKNPNVPAIPLKVKPPYKRDLSKAEKMWRSFNRFVLLKDIYINKRFDEYNLERYGQLSIDHFIPWSFVLHDEMWNLIPSFKNINSSKSNRLPDMDTYFNDFCQIQYGAFNFMRSHTQMKPLLEDYLHINIPLKFAHKKGLQNVDEEEFKKALTNTILPLYQIAYNQGYGIWKYKEYENNNSENCFYNINSEQEVDIVAEESSESYLKNIKKE